MSNSSVFWAVSGKSPVLWASAVLWLAVACGGGSSPSDVPGDAAPDGDPGPGVPCQGPDDCVDFEVDFCQVAVCSVDTGQCVALADKVKEGAVCDPDDPCAAVPKVCDSGACVHTQLKACEAKPCRLATGCDPSTGNCTYDLEPNGTACQPDDPCLQGSCEDGKCQEAPRCDDQDPCTDDACDPLTGECSHSDTDCDDGNPCTLDNCTPGVGCSSDPDIGLACDDLDECTATDLCDASGDCVGKDPTDCDDGNVCTDDTCDPLTGDCLHGDNTEPCEDGDPCTTGDSCTGSVCQAGLPVPGCCHAGPDCDDQDPCTEEACVDGSCQYAGEAPGGGGTGCVPGSACESGYCNATTGTCDTFDLTMPRGLVDWDLTVGTKPPGFRWTTVGGTLGPDGAAGSTGAPVSFRLAPHFAPAGIKVLHLHLTPGDSCGTEATAVTVGGVQVASSGCILGEGAPVVPYAWTDPAAALVDVEITVQPGGTVSRVTYQSWAASGCRPLGPVAAAPGTDITDLALAGNLRGMVAGYRRTAKSWSSSLHLQKGLNAASSLDSEDYATIPGKFTTSMVALQDGRYLFAYGGADKRVRLVLLEDGGQKVSTAVPDLFSPQSDDQYEPHLSPRDDGGAWLVYASSQVDGNGLGVARTSVIMTGDQIGPFGSVEPINLAPEGDQRRPVQWAPSDGTPGLVAWITDADQVIKARRLPLAAMPDTEVEVAETGGTVTFQDLALTRSEDRFYLVWQTSGGLVGGKVLDQDLVPTGDVDLTGVGSEQYDPSLANLASGALLLFTRVDGLDVNVVQVRVSGDGTVTNEGILSQQVNNLSAGPSAANCGPFMTCFGFVDTWTPSDKGLYLGFTSAACDKGPLDCSKPSVPGVCVGFGTPAYVPFPGATGWCQ